jgi:hypothetical protein
VSPHLLALGALGRAGSEACEEPVDDLVEVVEQTHVADVSQRRSSAPAMVAGKSRAAFAALTDGRAQVGPSGGGAAGVRRLFIAYELPL